MPTPETDSPTPTPPPARGSLAEVGAVFLKIGATAFGGPAAHVAIMHDEIVERRKWVDNQHFLDLLGATNLIPGPNSSEMSMHLGFVRAGLPGLIVGGGSFLLPAMLMVLALAWIYQEFGSTPAAEWLLYGVKPVIIPLIVSALIMLGQKAVRDRLSIVLGAAAFALYFLGVNFVLLLIGSGLVVMIARNADRLRPGPRLLIPLPLLGSSLFATPDAAAFGLGQMFLIFLKIGALLYGSGYVLFAYMHADLVEHLHWLTEQQLIDAIAVGQMTPGPLSTTATFIGYQLGGVPGALLATLGIYLPAFVIVAISNPLIPRIRRSPLASGFLDGVNVAALALMAAVTWELGRAAFVDLYTLTIGLVGAVLLFRYRANSALLVLYGAIMGLLSAVI
ncbi:MAG TPA: chromate efflux transporter [Aggregatilinea sp.]|uniref:chromate efflux transporter n=1 Tax=Aggregatilinea sp. TaxID=2806333 RepID=UPI002CB1E561|nr:chromate efflux transporter [Aggregatilinea sp.]HML24776.1 chromate efflux transporter [Aggregatilinea sp.]